MYRPKKHINNLSNQIIFAPVFSLIGLIVFLISFSKEEFSVQVILDNIMYLGMFIIGIYFFISSNRKLKNIKKLKFDISESSITIHDFTQQVELKKNEVKRILKSLKQIKIETFKGKVYKVDLSMYSLDYEELKILDEKVEKFNRNL